MKANTYTKRDVIKRARELQVSTHILELRHNPFRELDRRFNFDKEVAVYLRENKISEKERERILEIRRERAMNKYEFTNVLSNPVVKDYMKRKNEIKYINSERIHFWSGRNHWAKDAQDQKILQILKKYV